MFATDSALRSMAGLAALASTKKEFMEKMEQAGFPNRNATPGRAIPQQGPGSFEDQRMLYLQVVEHLLSEPETVHNAC